MIGKLIAAVMHILIYITSALKLHLQSNSSPKWSENNTLGVLKLWELL